MKNIDNMIDLYDTFVCKAMENVYKPSAIILILKFFFGKAVENVR